MTFFIPHAADEAQTQSVYDSIREFAADQTAHPIGDRRIRHVSYRHDGKTYESTVGQPDGRLGEEVIAILDSGPLYLVCTPNRGVIRGMPLLVGKNEAFAVADFEAE